MSKGFHLMALRPIQIAFLLSPCLCGFSFAQVPNESVQWAAAVISDGAGRHGSNATLDVSAQIQAGWHVYAVTQPPGGPTALRITVDENEVARVVGAPYGTTPKKKHDPSFDLDTRFYTRAFALHLPLQLTEQPTAGGQVIPVSVRFQTCSDRECLPPTTVHLSVTVGARPDAT